MKRKLDENDQPTEVTGDNNEATFGDLGLDARLLQAISHQGFKKPTLVQSKTIPLALDGTDILAKAKTGSGKTAAYVLPILQSILKRKQVCFATDRLELSEGKKLLTEQDIIRILYLRPYPRSYPRTCRPSRKSRRIILRLLHQGDPGSQAVRQSL